MLLRCPAILSIYNWISWFDRILFFGKDHQTIYYHASNDGELTKREEVLDQLSTMRGKIIVSLILLGCLFVGYHIDVQYRHRFIYNERRLLRREVPLPYRNELAMAVIRDWRLSQVADQVVEAVFVCLICLMLSSICWPAKKTNVQLVSIYSCGAAFLISMLIMRLSMYLLLRPLINLLTVGVAYGLVVGLTLRCLSSAILNSILGASILWFFLLYGFPRNPVVLWLYVPCSFIACFLSILIGKRMKTSQDERKGGTY